MQVFESFIYNLKDIKFKDTKVFFDDLLETLKLNYSGIIFCFNSDSEGNNCKKVIKNFPQLEEYTQNLKESARYFKSAPDYCLCSIKKDKEGNIEKYINPNHTDDFDALLKKIPKSINFGFMGIALDNVNWYDTISQKPALSSQYNIYDHKFSGYFSNSLRFFKEFDFGNKLNLVEIMIERIVSGNRLLPYPNEFKQLLNKLGKPKHSALKCVFDDIENEKCINASKEFNATLNESEKNFIIEKEALIKENYLIDSVTPISGFSPKTLFNKIAKTKGYTNFFGNNSCYRYKKNNSNNHTFIVELLNQPFSSFFITSISVVGYNFSHTIFTTQQETIKNEICAERYAKKVFDISAQLEKKYEEKLLLLYGETPQWYNMGD